jgi:epoxyqueuosine reductase
MTAASIESRIRELARDSGFSLVGFAPATEADGFPRFERWLDAGYAGAMAYLHKHREHRRHPRAVLETVRSVVMLGWEYFAEAGTTPDPARLGRVARYAQGPDYHRLIWSKLNSLRDILQAEYPGFAAHGTCDSAPLLERDFARRAGLGWFGKNTMLIHKQRGSFFFLASLLTNWDLKPDPPHTATHCGTCTACLDACPTRAFPEPGVLDARRCISYLTIELHGSIPLELREGIGDQLFGCDICQEVCPWNRHAEPYARGFPHQLELVALDPCELLQLTEGEFRRKFEGTSLLRARRSGLLRNAAIVLGNVGDSSCVPTLERAMHDRDSVIREAATWARDRIRARLTSDTHAGSATPS